MHVTLRFMLTIDGIVLNRIVVLYIERNLTPFEFWRIILYMDKTGEHSQRMVIDSTKENFLTYQKPSMFSIKEALSLSFLSSKLTAKRRIS